MIPYDVITDDNPYENGTDNHKTIDADDVEYIIYAELLGVNPVYPLSRASVGFTD